MGITNTLERYWSKGFAVYISKDTILKGKSKHCSLRQHCTGQSHEYFMMTNVYSLLWWRSRFCLSIWNYTEEVDIIKLNSKISLRKACFTWIILLCTAILIDMYLAFHGVWLQSKQYRDFAFQTLDPRQVFSVLFATFSKIHYPYKCN